MTGSTSIEWTDSTWNPVTGCTKVSPGCDRCYAEGLARRFAGTPAFPNGFAVTLRPGRLDAPLRWRRPSRVFVNSMSDLFHDQVPDAFIARVWAVMAGTGRHTYHLLGPIDLHDEWAGLDWLIVGGESGPGARRMDPAWAASLVTRCRVLGVAPFVKQLGSAHGPGKGGDLATWPAVLRVREFPGGGS